MTNVFEKLFTAFFKTVTYVIILQQLFARGVVNIVE